mmetsp:Transcript_20592/g.34485  ORF Transcript_20592/g.34485 Transcript_20592/m.34485 type:complete len:443 (-) Transcript_20592:3439-4767(-)
MAIVSTGNSSTLEKPTLVVATDTGQHDFKNQLPFPVMTILPPNECFGDAGRLPVCQQHALATMYRLSRTSIFIGSKWSSFSEIIAVMTGKTEQLFGCEERHETNSVLEHGVSVVTACHDANKAPLTTIDAALLSAANEIIVVDWSSPIPIQSNPDPRLKFLRVENETSWSAVRAYNLGFQHTTYKEILKVGCDTVLEPFFFQTHVLMKGSFFTSNGHMPPGNHLDDILYLHRKALMSVGGYDERLSTQDGWAESDLTMRLRNLGLKKHGVNQSAVNKLSTYPVQTQGQFFQLEVMKLRKRVCAKKLLGWRSVQHSMYRNAIADGFVLGPLVSTFRPYPITQFAGCSDSSLAGHVLWRVFEKGDEKCKQVYWRKNDQWAKANEKDVVQLLVRAVALSWCSRSRWELELLAKECVDYWSTPMNEACNRLSDMVGRRGNCTCRDW